MSIILKAENISKQYRLGTVGTGTLSHDLNRWWHQIRGKEDPYLQIGAVNDRSTKASQEYIWALKNINFEVRTGEVLGIIGKNGAGKSTLLKLLSKVTSPTTGSIKTKGRIASLLEVGTGFHPELTGRENIYLNGAILGMTKAEIKAKIDEIIAFSGCEMYIDTPVKRYSSGMRVRLGFAVAAHLEPEILVVDEVLAVGDAEFQKKAIGKMQDLSTGEGRTVLFVSHNMGSIKQLCNRSLLLENGATRFIGDVNEGIDLYLLGNNEKNEEKLANRNDRKGRKFFKFTQISCLDFRNQSVKSLISGEKYSFHMFYENRAKLYAVAIRLLFVDNKGMVRFLCNNKFSSSEVALDRNESGELKCIIPKFPLPNGNYSIHLTCFSSEGVEDDIENTFDFEVLGGDFFGTGKEQILRDGVLVENKFKFYDD
ncbi:ABC transporter ATP-binding protein [Zunongwangia sp. SCSIO 43204]|uniref:ABC transporter ATP-binding protein n=1 Tax=Zunongwangia sp. SCSIO 43204 TaxID=2779359 RepID=UPI001CA9AEA5|nr:ABC transporter ATP-binding protein [Zunongwangia sp. SCSIO 43204]UAB86163.1 ABC transporter ATP-binding protein [Zunongwangia sp. SCSIO 43204]